MTKTIDALVEALETAVNVWDKNFPESKEGLPPYRRVPPPWVNKARAALAQYATDYNRPLNQTERNQLEAFASKFDVRAEQAEPQPEQAGPIVDGWQLSVADGHSGHGVYAHMTEYPDEGAVLVLPITPRAEQAEPFGYVSEHNCEGPFKLQFQKTLAEVYSDNFTTITPVYTAASVANLEPLPTQDVVRIALATGMQSSEEHWGTVYRAVGLSNLRAFADAITAAHAAKLKGGA